jgi:HlyD family secretion protein
MVHFLKTHKYFVAILLIATTIGIYSIYSYATTDPLAGLITTQVERGAVESLVSVSGLTKARNAAELGFKTTGTVSTVFVREGDTVKEGDILATLGAEELISTRASAVADVRVAEADLAELLQGDTATVRVITDTKAAIAEAELERTISAQGILVENAKRTLRSSDLAAKTIDEDENATAPAITGTYRCDRDGVYTITVYRSNAESGYSMQLSGLESGTFPISTEQPVAFGSCGLYAQFSANTQYGNSVWTITIPNTAAASYTTNKNALLAAETTARTSIAAATQAKTLATQEKVAANAAPRNEAVVRAQARIDKARALVAQIDTQIGDRAIMAPFDGIITTVDIVAGETAGTAPLFTLLATDGIELRARIPEIDITAVAVGQRTRTVFDAQPGETLDGTVLYIAPLPIQIDGVGYFEITIALDTPPTWLRGGLNADIDIIINRTENTLRIPKRYLIKDDATSSVLTLTAGSVATTTITTLREGNDGWVAIEGIPEGTTVVTP